MQNSGDVTARTRTRCTKANYITACCDYIDRFSRLSYFSPITSSLARRTRVNEKHLHTRRQPRCRLHGLTGGCTVAWNNRVSAFTFSFTHSPTPINQHTLYKEGTKNWLGVATATVTDTRSIMRQRRGAIVDAITVTVTFSATTTRRCFSSTHHTVHQSVKRAGAISG